MSKKSSTLRFAFGNARFPGSAVWRVIVRRKKGDVFINNVKEMGDRVHISLHASGKFSMRLDDIRHKLEGPVAFDNKNKFMGLVIFFYGWRRNIQPLPASGSIDEIKWLGWPMESQLVCVEFVYVIKKGSLILKENQHVLGIFNAKLFHEEILLYVLVQKREYMKNEKNLSDPSADHRRVNIDMKGNKIKGGELVRVTKTEQGVSAIIIEEFYASLKGN